MWCTVLALALGYKFLDESGHELRHGWSDDDFRYESPRATEECEYRKSLLPVSHQTKSTDPLTTHYPPAHPPAFNAQANRRPTGSLPCATRHRVNRTVHNQ